MSLVTTTPPRAGLALVELDDPERYNALTTDGHRAWAETFARIRTDRTVRVVVLAGRGRGFCAGANMAGDDDPPDSAKDRGPVGLIQMMQEHLAELILAVHELPQPVIAAVHGAAVGGGLALSLAAFRPAS